MTVVLGGLMENVSKQNVSKVPLLDAILPLVGQLFRYTSEDTSKRNLMVFIHTTVLRDDDNYSAATKENMTRSAVNSSVWRRKSSASLRTPITPSCLPIQKAGSLHAGRRERTCYHAQPLQRVGR